MPIHDAFCRVTPFELALPGEDYAERRFPRIREEAREREADLGDPEAFPLLSEVGGILREIRSEDDDPRLLNQLGLILYHAFHFWEEGCPLFLMETAAVRFLVDTGPGEGEWDPSLPGRAGYVQLPQHLFWAPGGEGQPPESLDGFFWSAPGGETLSILVVMGMRKDRPGLSVVPLPPLPLEAAATWASIQVRPHGPDFRSTLPGAELERLYAVEAGAEAVKLAMRVFWYLDSFPGAVAGGVDPSAEPERSHAVESPSPVPTDEAGGPTPSRLSFRRIVLGDA